LKVTIKQICTLSNPVGEDGRRETLEDSLVAMRSGDDLPRRPQIVALQNFLSDRDILEAENKSKELSFSVESAHLKIKVWGSSSFKSRLTIGVYGV
jgi:hypothetical protein